MCMYNIYMYMIYIIGISINTYIYIWAIYIVHERNCIIEFLN